MKPYQLGVIGGGNMAEAIVRGLAAAGERVLPIGEVVVSEVLPARRELLSVQVGVACVADNAVPAACPRVILAVKPQVIPKVLEEIAPLVRADATVISIAAGITTAFIARRLGGRGRIVRVMPNTPMLVGAGASAIAAGSGAAAEDLAWTQQIFAASGTTVIVPEGLMDAVTAVSGSGPAYFFYLIEAMIAAGVAEGMDADVAALLATQTCAGAAKLLAQSHLPPEALRAKVTSPGGTTQRAVETMEAAGVKDALVRAIRAAAARSRELGQ